MHSLAQALRRAARAALPEGAFLRRDRGEALFVTDAPRRRPDADWPAVCAEAGFLCRARDSLLFLTPDPTWPARLEAAFPVPPDPFSASLSRFAGRPADGESLALFALGAQILDGGRDDGGFGRRLRRRAAACLRLNRTLGEPNGGGLYACALVKYIIEEERT